ncbi:MAG: site-2 protease family protein [Myxococcota bacterium]
MFLFQDPQRLVMLALVLMISLTVHEFAHAWSAYLLGDDTAHREGRVSLNPLVHLDLMGSLCFLVSGMFGWAKPVPVNPRFFKHPRRDDIIVTGAGPLSNLILGTISMIILCVILLNSSEFSVYYKLYNAQNSFQILLQSFVENQQKTFINSFLLLMIFANYSLAFFNLIPLFPLDGSHIVQNLLPLRQADEFRRFNDQWGPWVLLALILAPSFTQGAVDPVGWFITTPVRGIINTLGMLFFHG